MNRMQGFALAALLLTATVQSDWSDARADRARFPQHEWGYFYYFTLSDRPEELHDNLVSDLNFVVASLSSKTHLSQLPKRVTKTLLRIDTRELGWEKQLHAELRENYPFYPYHLRDRHHAPLVISAAWFVAEVMDPVRTGDMQYQLLYSGKVPKTAAEFTAFWQGAKGSGDTFGFIEGKAGPSVAGERVLETRDQGNRGILRQAYDSRRIAGETDPLENLLARPPKHDATELIAQIPKSLGDERGFLSACFLGNGNRQGVAGQRQEAAPIDIVEDGEGLRGFDIRNTIDCLNCHVHGAQLPTLDKYEQFFVSGARVYASKADQIEIDRYYDSPYLQDVLEARKGWAKAIELINGYTPELNAKNFRFWIEDYDKPVDLERAAMELSTTAEELKLAIAYYEKSGRMKGRPALLANGVSISRDQFLENWHLYQEAIIAWQN